MSGRSARATLAASIVALALVAGGGSAAASPAGTFGSVNLAFYRAVHVPDAAMMASGGIRTARLSFDWFGVEGTKGTYTWDKLDRVVGNLASQGITTLPVLFGTPRWAVTDLPTNPFPEPDPAKIAGDPIQKSRPSGNATAYSPTLTPDARAGWKRFLTAAVQRYGPGGSYWTVPYQVAHPGATPHPIRTWQIWNEPNIPYAFWPAANVKRYGKLLRLSANTIRAADPGAMIALAGMPGRVRFRGVRFINELYRRDPGIGRYFNYVTFHPYAPTIKGSMKQLLNLRRVLRRHHDPAVPLWISEIGWSSGKPGKNQFDHGPHGQARMLRRFFTVLMRDRRRLHLRRVSWFDWRDPKHNDPDCGWCARAGLFDWQHQPKPAWNAFRAFTMPTP
jgi:hypothetical protein